MKKITELQQKTLFDLDAFAIEQVPLRESICDWDWELAGIELLPTFREQSSRRRLTNSDSLLPNSDSLLPKIREQPPPESSKKLLPNQEIREQLQTGQTVIGYSIVNVKGKKYYLTHSQSNKYYPADKGWFDIKSKGGIDYLYIRWRDSLSKQKSRCLGRVDRVE